MKITHFLYSTATQRQRRQRVIEKVIVFNLAADAKSIFSSIQKEKKMDLKIIVRRNVSRPIFPFSFSYISMYLIMPPGPARRGHREKERVLILMASFPSVVEREKIMHFSKWLTRPLMMRSRRTHEQDTNLHDCVPEHNRSVINQLINGTEMLCHAATRIIP